jgi:hypothetical protein
MDGNPDDVERHAPEFNLHLASGSRMLLPRRRTIVVKLSQSTQQVAFAGPPIEVSF